MPEYMLTRTNRKTLALYVRGGAIEVRAPLRVPKRDIDAFVASKQAWLDRKLTQSAERAEKRGAFTLAYGDTVVYRGVRYHIIGTAGQKIFFDGGFYIPEALSPDEIKAACVQLYRLLARRYLTSRTFELAEKLGVAPSAVKINGAVTRWGSCSGKKSINFSWRLVMADDDVIDYVIIHELAHIPEMNHSAKFWAIVGGLAPDYKELRKRLHALQLRLGTEKWE